MRGIFEDIYRRDLWGNGSGEGSRPVNTEGYRAFLQGFLRANQVRTVVDFGCGDWQFSRLVDWDGIDYRGYDVAPFVVDANRANFTRDNISFHLIDDDIEALPAADLLIAKDVLQHWPHEAVHRFRAILDRYRFSLITNCVNPRGATENVDIGPGSYHPLDLTRAPFFWPLKEVYAFAEPIAVWRRPFVAPRWRKKVFLNRGAFVR